MITITQFHFLQIKLAKEALAQKPAPVPATSEEAPSDPTLAPQADTVQSSSETQTDDKNTAEKSTGSDKKDPKAPASATPEDLAAIQQALNCDEKKASYMFAAIQLAGRRVDRVRQVRIVQAEKAPQAAIVVEDIAYILDMHPEPAKSKSSRHQDDGKRGKKRGGKGKRGGRPRGPGDKTSDHARGEENKDGGHKTHSDRPRRHASRPAPASTDAPGTDASRRPQHSNKRPTSTNHKPPKVEVVPALGKAPAPKPS